jgi:hypothetical protein
LTDRLRLVSWGMLVAPLAFFYFYFFAWALKSGEIPPTSAIEVAVLATMVARLSIVMSVDGLRRARASIIIDIFALEVLVIAALLVLYIALRTPVYLSTLTAIALAWPAALLLVFPPFALYRFASRMLEGAKLSTVIPYAIGLFALLVIPAEVATLAATTRGLAGISRLLLAVLLGQARTATLQPEVTFTGLLLYLALTFYVITRGGSETGADGLAPLLVAVAGSVVALSWAALGSFLTDDLFLLFAAPGLAIIGVIWWTTRGR